MDKMIINGIEYVPASAQVKGDQLIAVFAHGWVFAGTKAPATEGAPAGTVHLVNAKNIRRWGTTNGLGELRTGPTPNTIVDEYGDVEGVPLFTMSARGW